MRCLWQSAARAGPAIISNLPPVAPGVEVCGQKGGGARAGLSALGSAFAGYVLPGTVVLSVMVVWLRRWTVAPGENTMSVVMESIAGTLVRHRTRTDIAGSHA